jgi:hypothetical protein
MERGMTQQYDTEYLTQAIDEEIALAKLDRNIVGARPSVVWRDAQVYPKVDRRKAEGRWCGFAPAPLPAYRRDARTAGELLIRRGLNVKHDHDECSVSVSYGSSRRAVTEFYGAHPDVQAATMAAITRAAIQLLTELRDERAALYPSSASSRRRPGARAKSQ